MTDAEYRNAPPRLLSLRSLEVVKRPDGVQISVGQPHDFRSEDLTDAEAMRLMAILRLAVADDERGVPGAVVEP